VMSKYSIDYNIPRTPSKGMGMMPTQNECVLALSAQAVEGYSPQIDFT